MDQSCTKYSELDYKSSGLLIQLLTGFFVLLIMLLLLMVLFLAFAPLTHLYHVCIQPCLA